jgi:hypothetical protein
MNKKQRCAECNEILGEYTASNLVYGDNRKWCDDLCMSRTNNRECREAQKKLDAKNSKKKGWL